MITNIASVTVYVEDQTIAKSFWTEKVGFQLIKEISMGGNNYWMEVAPPEGGTVLVIYPRALMRNSDRMQPSIMFACKDIQQTYERMKQNGVEFLSAPTPMKWGTFAQFYDTEGYVHFLKQSD